MHEMNIPALPGLRRNSKASRAVAAVHASPYFVLLAICLLPFVLGMLRPLSVPDEGRYAEIGRWMLQSGDWLVPRLNGIPFYHKPPLLHWLLAASMAAFGVCIPAARVVPALSAAILLFSLYLSTRALLGVAVARRASIMLGTSLAFLIGGQYVNHDMLVAACISVAIWCFALAIMRGKVPHSGLARAGFVACALGVLAKGLIGIVLPGLVLFTWLVWTRQLRVLPRLPWLSGSCLFLIVALPWFVLAQQHDPGMARYLFGVQQFARYTGTNFNNAQPWWYYCLTTCVLLFPWCFFALAQIGRPREARPPVERRTIALAWCWFISILVFFSVPNSKLIGYMLPAMPPLAMLASLGWQRWAEGRSWSGRAFAALAATATLLAIAVSTFAEHVTQDKLAIDIAATLRRAAQPEDTVYAVGGYPHDLQFLAQLKSPMVVVQDWDAARRDNSDNWRRELLEGIQFNPQASNLLQAPDVLAAASRVAGHWMVAPVGYEGKDLDGWTLVQHGSGWVLYRASPALAVARAPSAQVEPGRCPRSRNAVFER
jgi:4-amino-4-deoxy-L-arabinose transferase-like glycosyltransferase